MDGKDMTLQDYGALNGSIIYVNQIDWFILYLFYIYISIDH